MTFRAPLTLVATLAILCAGPATAQASSDAASTAAYLQANYALDSYAASHIRAAEATLSGVLRGIRRECPQAAAESPENTDSEQLSNEVIGAMVTTVVQHNLPVASRFIKAVAPLRWSSAKLTHAIHSYVANVKVLETLTVPHVCADVKSWVASDYRTLPASTVSFDARFMPAWVAPGDLPGSLTAYETPAERALARRSAQLEQQWTEFEAREVETWGQIMDEMVLQP
jgi:hypothetical protein